MGASLLPSIADGKLQIIVVRANDGIAVGVGCRMRLCSYRQFVISTIARIVRACPIHLVSPSRRVPIGSDTIVELSYTDENGATVSYTVQVSSDIIMYAVEFILTPLVP